ncbi:MAG: winged helix-turn-helix transcriptional regulator [Rhodospirillales bacterium]|jgi:DNA-binding transcriptional ArsR family regulator|nr:winged helix-turn-helix transcriptional regulator [Rhodospirillales bacterium]MBT4038488.1 winged helix-turn-helix transcriptional regulator [Rhodospirillales bacterium]MBT4625657.1 winged helix-turn-helix transcriptional regulator [Rhodospirillales bacterium]MBT5351839.1 winged helix-turn-helix transcriptional regulator [Rhodospirillales bacterium]MBT5519199.1 winged helix-turn-helix transcriptional regulator [Rhodospirillales bacterium]
MVDKLEQSKALASDARLSILRWLIDPDAHFLHQVTGKPSEIGVCVTLLTEKLDMAQPTVSRHLELLRRAGFLTVNKVGRWSFFQRDEAAVIEFKAWINENL